MPQATPPLSVADVLGPWKECDFDSGLIQRCRRYWSVPVSDLPNEVLATFLRQKIAVELIASEVKRRIAEDFHDDTEMYDKELENALKSIDK
jgi:hypothetical protein